MADDRSPRWKGLVAIGMKETILQKYADLSARDRKLFEECIENHIPSIERWPLGMLALVLETHLRYEDRTKLTNFMLINRVPPVLYVKWLLMRKMLKDFSARKQVATIIMQHKSGELQQKSVHAYEIEAVTQDGNPTKNYQIIMTPDMANNPSYEHHWLDAIQMLHRNSLDPYVQQDVLPQSLNNFYYVPAPAPKPIKMKRTFATFSEGDHVQLGVMVRFYCPYKLPINSVQQLVRSHLLSHSLNALPIEAEDIALNISKKPIIEATLPGSVIWEVMNLISDRNSGYDLA